MRVLGLLDPGVGFRLVSLSLSACAAPVTSRRTGRKGLAIAHLTDGAKDWALRAFVDICTGQAKLSTAVGMQCTHENKAQSLAPDLMKGRHIVYW